MEVNPYQTPAEPTQTPPAAAAPSPLWLRFVRRGFLLLFVGAILCILGAFFLVRSDVGATGVQPPPYNDELMTIALLLITPGASLELLGLSMFVVGGIGCLIHALTGDFKSLANDRSA